MSDTTTKQTAVEVGKVLDALSALSVNIECHADIPDEVLVLPAHRVRDTCTAIRQAVAALKHILAIAEDAGGGVIPPDVQQRLSGSKD